MSPLLYKLLTQSDNSVFIAMQKTLSKFGKVKTDGENYLYLKRPGSKICLAAHLDTVCDGKFKRVEENKGSVYNLNGVLGADDRAGLYAIVNLLKIGIPFDVIITNYEERGALGASAFVKDGLFIPDKIELIIQLDRRGENDYVTYNTIAPEISQYVESFGFKENMGTFSDIAIIAPDYGLNAVNLSIGYTGEHTPNEALNINWVNATIKKVGEMIKSPPGKIYPLPLDLSWSYQDNICHFCGSPLIGDDFLTGYCEHCGSFGWNDFDAIIPGKFPN